MDTGSRCSQFLACALGAAALFSASPVRLQGQAPERRVVLVSVLDQEGNHVPGLSAAHFRGECQGRPVTILSAAEDSTPRRVSVVVDVSGSQEQSAGLEWQQAVQLIDGLIPAHAVALFTLGRVLTKHADFTNDRAVLQRAMRDARAGRAGGPSALYDGVVQAALGFPGPQLGDTICLFSDGVDTSSEQPAADVARRLTDLRIRVFLAGTTTTWDARGPVPEWRTITDATGGLIVWNDSARPDPASVARVRQRVLAGITNAYRLDLAFERGIDRFREWKLQLADSARAATGNARVIYPRRLAPLAKQ